MFTQPESAVHMYEMRTSPCRVLVRIKRGVWGAEVGSGGGGVKGGRRAGTAEPGMEEQWETVTALPPSSVSCKH